MAHTHTDTHTHARLKKKSQNKIPQRLGLHPVQPEAPQGWSSRRSGGGVGGRRGELGCDMGGGGGGGELGCEMSGEGGRCRRRGGTGVAQALESVCCPFLFLIICLFFSIICHFCCFVRGASAGVSSGVRESARAREGNSEREAASERERGEREERERRERRERERRARACARASEREKRYRPRYRSRYRPRYRPSIAGPARDSYCIFL
jgi:hypothetical protein